MRNLLRRKPPITDWPERKAARAAISERDGWSAPGGLYDNSLVTDEDREYCAKYGHDASYGTLFGWCHRCQHTVWSHDQKSVLYRGQYHRKPPRHEPSGVEVVD
jgi:hypothetical protein